MPAKHLIRVNDRGTYFHIYNTGVESRVIFADTQDYEVFIGFLKDYLTPPQDLQINKKTFTVHGKTYQGTPYQTKNYFNKVEVLAYSLMPNHFHLLVHQRSKGSVANLIRSLCTRYSVYFNKRHSRKGALFDGPYKSINVKDDESLLDLTLFFHKHNTLHSSSFEYLGKRDTLWIKPSLVLNETTTPSDYQERLNSYTFTEVDGITTSPAPLPIGPTFDVHSPAVLVPDKIVEKYVRLRPFQRIPEFIGFAGFFVVLLTIGIANINANSPKVVARTEPIEEVLSESDEIIYETPHPIFMLDTINSTDSGEIAEATPYPTPTPIYILIPSLSDDGDTGGLGNQTPASALPQSSSSSLETVGILSVKISDNSGIAVVHQEPKETSPILIEAFDGDKFEYISLEANWYQVMLRGGQRGYIQDTYVSIDQTY